jgi:hypothetical protein
MYTLPVLILSCVPFSGRWAGLTKTPRTFPTMMSKREDWRRSSHRLRRNQNQVVETSEVCRKRSRFFWIILEPAMSFCLSQPACAPVLQSGVLTHFFFACNQVSHFGIFNRQAPVEIIHRCKLFTGLYFANAAGSNRSQANSMYSSRSLAPMR